MPMTPTRGSSVKRGAGKRLFHETPVASARRVPDCRLRHAVCRRDALGGDSASVHMANGSDGYVVEPCLGVAFAASLAHSALRNHVSHVIEIRSEEQMIRSNARRIVAPMANMHPVGNPAVADAPRDTVCADANIALNGELAVRFVCGEDGSNPLPALSALVHLAPEASEHLGIQDGFRDTIIEHGFDSLCRGCEGVGAVFAAPAPLVYHELRHLAEELR